MKKIELNGELYEVGDDPKCPQCGKPNICEHHKYVYSKWIDGLEKAYPRSD